jgi:hypothetical protein
VGKFCAFNSFFEVFQFFFELSVQLTKLFYSSGAIKLFFLHVSNLENLILKFSENFGSSSFGLGAKLSQSMKQQNEIKSKKRFIIILFFKETLFLSIDSKTP